MVSPPVTPSRSPVLPLLVAIFVLAIAAVPVLPHYVTGHWPWLHPPSLQPISQLRQLQEQGLTLPGWKTLEQQPLQIGGKDWSAQAIVPLSAPEQPSPTILLLRPQTWHQDQPSVEWMDLNGAQQWTADTKTHLTFTLPSRASSTLPPTAQSLHSAIAVHARFFRGWTEQQTYAVLQWYALPNGGTPAAGHWFWADQKSQLRDRRRTPWVAVSLLIPIEPLGDITTAAPLAKTLGQLIQSQLMQTVLSSQ